MEGEQTFVQRYNSENRLSNIDLVGGDCEEHGTTSKEWEFVYDGDGVKVKQVFTEGESVLTTYYYAGGRGLCTPERFSCPGCFGHGCERGSTKCKPTALPKR